MRMLIAVAAVLLLPGACQREILNRPASIKSNSAAARVKEWLNEQKEKLVKPTSKEKFQRLVERLHLRDLHYEEFQEGEMLIVIPVDSGFFSDNNRERNPVNCLLLFESKNGDIHSGNIVQYMGPVKSCESGIPLNTFYKFYNGSKLEASRITFLTITDKFLYEKEYENGRLCRFSVLVDKAQGTSGYKRRPANSMTQ